MGSDQISLIRVGQGMPLGLIPMGSSQKSVASLLDQVVSCLFPPQLLGSSHVWFWLQNQSVFGCDSVFIVGLGAAKSRTSSSLSLACFFVGVFLVAWFCKKQKKCFASPYQEMSEVSSTSSLPFRLAGDFWSTGALERRLRAAVAEAASEGSGDG